MATQPSRYQIAEARAGELVRHYLGGPYSLRMSEDLAAAILVCRWAETLLANAGPAGVRLRPVFDRDLADLAAEWKRIARDQVLDTYTGKPATNVPPEDLAGDRYLPWKIEDQESLLFGRWSYLFRI